MELATQVTVTMKNVPSSLAKVGDKLRASDVNIEAISCTEGKDSTAIHLIVSDPDTAKIVLRELGTVKAEEVLALKMKNKTGAIADIGRALAAAGINIGIIYATTCGKEAMVYVTVLNAGVKEALVAMKAWEKTRSAAMA
jgi:hypothetical protein